MNKKLGYIAIFVAGVFLSGCDLGTEPAKEGTKLQVMCGEWFVRVLQDGDDIGGGYYLVTTSNTADNNETDLILDDHETWPAKVITKVSLGGMTFNAAPNLTNMYDAKVGVSILEGKIIKGAATSTGGNKTDSIYVKFEFVDKGEKSVIDYAGYRRTGFLEDEH